MTGLESGGTGCSVKEYRHGIVRDGAETGRKAGEHMAIKSPPMTSYSSTELYLGKTSF